MTWIAELAKSEVERNPDSRTARENVAAEVRQRLAQSPELAAELAEPVVAAAVANEIAKARSAAKAVIKRPEVAPPPGLSLAVAATTAARSMLTMIVGNKRLAECTAGDLAIAREQHTKAAVGNLRMATFFDVVAGRIGGKSVGEVMDDATLRTLFENVGKHTVAQVA